MRLRHTHELSYEFRDELLAFLIDAFAGDFTADDFDHALGGVHVVVEDDSGLLGHAAVVQRRVVVGEVDEHARVVRTGYVEAVAVASRARRRGIGDEIMRNVDEIVDSGFEIGLLAASDAGRPLYLRHGWTPWTGPVGTLTPTGLAWTPDDDGCILARIPQRAADIDPTAAAHCDWRSGAPW